MNDPDSPRQVCVGTWGSNASATTGAASTSRFMTWGGTASTSSTGGSSGSHAESEGVVSMATIKDSVVTRTALCFHIESALGPATEKTTSYSCVRCEDMRNHLLKEQLSDTCDDCCYQGTKYGKSFIIKILVKTQLQGGHSCGIGESFGVWVVGSMWSGPQRCERQQQSSRNK
jgi:hypothetical protein